MTYRILAVEDDPNILISLEFILRSAGHDVTTASDGAQGWAALEHQIPDLVVLDIMLPLVDGFELARRIRASPRLNSVKILMLSARGREAEITKGYALGADAYITKPFSTRDLADTVRRLLDVP